MINETRYRITTWGKTGAYEGAKLGFLIGFRYMVATTLFIAFITLLGVIAKAVGDGNAESLVGIVVGIMFLLVVWFVGFVIGVLPAAVVGAVIGGVVGSVIALPSIYASRWFRRVVSVEIAIFVVLIAATPLFEVYNLMLNQVLSNPMFWYFVGVPLLFCFGAMARLGDRLPTLAPVAMPYETIAEERPVLPPLWLE